MKTYLIRILPATLALTADQISKYVVRRELTDAGRQTLIPGILAFRYAENTGAAFSFLAAHPMLLTLATAALIVMVCLWLGLDKKMNTLCAAGLSLIAGGGIGNLIDRIFFGYVTDFIEVLFVRFAIFNIADCAICIGAFVCMISLLGKENACDRDPTHR